LERWIEAFNMELGDDGHWHWAEGLIQDRDKWFNEFTKLLAEWNKFVPRYNARIDPRNMGRPLQASEAQCQRVLQRRKSGQSLRSIAEEMTLSLQTVRTIIDRKDGVDRATIRRLQRIAPDKIAETRARRSSKEIAALPKRINANLKRNAELIKAAKGLE
jgi:DNA-binding CsgD family transcriptional regulator